jgi:hypothetical protein
MRTYKITLVALIVFCVLAPTPAYAWLGDGWIEKLSGPGPFRGFNIDLRLVCLASPDAPPDPRARPRGEKSIDQMLADNSLAKAGTFPHRSDSGAWATLFGCHFLTRDEPRLELGFQYNRLSAKGEENLLDYSHLAGVTPEDKDVRFNSVMLTADLRINRVVDLGAAIGRGAFSSPGGLFNSFSKLVFQPVRVTVRPLSTVMRNSRLVEALMIRGEGTMFKGGFTDAEFGARPGSYSEPGEIVWGWSIVFDVSTLFWGNN